MTNVPNVDHCSSPKSMIGCSVSGLLTTNHMKWFELLQWPAMLITVVAAWLTGSQRKPRRMLGFWCFLVSNVLWVVWGWYDRAWAMIVLQIALAAMNIRGVNKNET